MWCQCRCRCHCQTIPMQSSVYTQITYCVCVCKMILLVLYIYINVCVFVWFRLFFSCLLRETPARQSKRESRKLNEIICLVSTTYGKKLRQFIVILPGFGCVCVSGVCVGMCHIFRHSFMVYRIYATPKHNSSSHRAHFDLSDTANR